MLISLYWMRYVQAWMQLPKLQQIWKYTESVKSRRIRGYVPTLGTFERQKNDRRMVEMSSVVKQNLYKYNKNWETLLVYLLWTKASFKAAKIADYKSLNAQLFFAMQHTKRSIKKIPPHLLRLLHHDHFTDMHHRSPYQLTYLL